MATSEMGCTDSAFAMVRGIVSMIDLAVFDVSAEVVNGFLVVQVFVQNLGTLDASNFNLYYTSSTGQRIREVVEETLPAGRNILYKFVTNLQINSDITVSHVCVNVGMDGDENPDNNEDCFAFEEAFKDMNPYPNPADDELIIEYIIPYNAVVKIELFNSFGESTHLLYEGESETGFNQHKFNVSTIDQGVYFYRIEYEGNLKTHQVIIK